MGADVVGWRDCPLQRELGEGGFLRQQKLLAYKRAAERQLPPGQRDAVPIRIHVTGEPVRTTSYSALCEELGSFEDGIPECASCPLAEGRPVGCYRFVTFPIATAIEEALGRLAHRELSRPASALRTLAEAFLDDPEHGAASEDFRTNRGARPGCLAERPEAIPLPAAGLETLDTADLLAILFAPVQEGDTLRLAASWSTLWLASCAERAVGAPTSRWSEWDSLARAVIETYELSHQNAGAAILVDA